MNNLLIHDSKESFNNWLSAMDTANDLPGLRGGHYTRGFAHTDGRVICKVKAEDVSENVREGLLTKKEAKEAGWFGGVESVQIAARRASKTAERIARREARQK